MNGVLYFLNAFTLNAPYNKSSRESRGIKKHTLLFGILICETQ
ncbi:MAG: hypothetical protein RL060_1964 [Bacteroidota bacterium]|jgi:hypothetical protein